MRPSGWTEHLLLLVAALLFAIAVAGLYMLGWAFFGETERPLVVQYISAGIGAIYTAITGFILLENRRMRIQTMQPHVQLVTHGYSDETGLLVDLENSGAGPAVDVSLQAWVLKRTGSEYNPLPVVFRAVLHAIPVHAAPARISLTKYESENATDFKDWRTAYEGAKANVSMDKNLLLLSLSFSQVGGGKMSSCHLVSLQEQPKVST
jgi:hypothetical protein